MSKSDKSEIVQQLNKDLLATTTGFLVQSNNINAHAVEKVNRYLPELDEKTQAFDRKNSQTSLGLMTLTMMTGQSPYRIMRQIMAETERRKSALLESQVTHAKYLEEIERLQHLDDPVSIAKYRHKCISIITLETKINGSLKDIAILIDMYNNIKETNNIQDWDEVAFEKEEKRHHVRRGFELMYRNLLQSGSPSVSTIEYCQQYGIHPQVCLTEVGGYIQHTSKLITEGQRLPHSNELEDFLDAMADKYVGGVDATAERIFGRSDFTSKEYMYKSVTN